MSKLESLIDEAAVEWGKLTIGQKKFIALVSFPGSVLTVALTALLAIIASVAGQEAYSIAFGVPSDGFVLGVYWAVSKALNYWWLCLIPLVTTPLALAGLEYKARMQYWLGSCYACVTF